MQKIVIKRPTFFIKRGLFKIFDSNNNIFYSSNFAPNKKIFSLPKGIFFLIGNIEKINYSRPVLKLPKKERDYYHDFRNFKIKFDVNPNKASIFHNEKLIIFDNSFKSKNQIELLFILFHEKGHNFFETEKFADLYAARVLLKNGFNRSQILIAMLNTLSHNNISRINFVKNKIYEN